MAFDELYGTRIVLSRCLPPGKFAGTRVVGELRPRFAPYSTLLAMIRSLASFAFASALAAHLALSTFVPGAAHAAEAAAAADIPAQIKTATDSAAFRRFVLDHGMRVLLVSDPRFNKSAAALAVNVGQIDDPNDREGLAHFLEHMMFLGTEKYPDGAEYWNFIRTNGGNNNAYTTTDHTNYHFDVRHDAFPAALDRFAQFFIAPLFNADFTGREVNAVHNEAMRHVQNDLRRIMSVARELYDPASGESKFSVGNKDTLAGATAAVVRAFYERHYTADQMALSVAGKASLDELEKLARDNFSRVPRRNVAAPVREARFLPKKPALRLAQIEPVKQTRQLMVEFPVGPTRPDFLSRPDRLVTELISHSGPGGVEALLKRDGLIHSLSASLWERTGQYGSINVSVALTPEGQARHARVLATIFSYLQFLREAPFPAVYYNERARIAQLNETYRDRGEGAGLAAQLANQALFYPLEIAERASDVWGRPDPDAYRRLLAALTPDNALVMLAAKGVTTNRRERFYDVAYSYTEDSGPAYAALLAPPKVAAFALPGANPFMPASARLLTERPLALIAEPGLQLYYAQDVEFQRPETALMFRFVPVREIASARAVALLRLYEICFRDFLLPMSGDSQLAGVNNAFDASLEGLSLSVSGFGDSPRRFAESLAEHLLTFEVTAERFAALKEASLRGLQSYDQNEAWHLARDRRDAFSREFYFMPGELVAPTQAATWSEVSAFARRFLARGKLEALVHGHISADDAVAVTRAIAARIGARPAPAEELLKRRHVDLLRAENVVDAGEIAGVNSAWLRDYVLPDDSATTRAAAAIVSSFFSSPFFDELRTRQQLGYIVDSSSSVSQRQRYLSFIIQSSTHAPDDLRARAERFIATLPDSLAATDDLAWATLVAGVRARLEQKPKSIVEKAGQMSANAFLYDGDWERRPATLAALDTLTRDQAVAFLRAALAPETSRQRTVLLHSRSHPPAQATLPAFSDRAAWKSTRHFQ